MAIGHGRGRRVQRRGRRGVHFGSVGWGLVAAGQMILAAMVFGGPIPGLGVVLLMTVSALVVFASLPFVGDERYWRSQPFFFKAGLFGVALLPLLQLVPLPPALWHHLPAQDVRIQVLALAGLADSWQPLSLTPVDTAGAAVMAIAFVALVRLMMILPAADLRRIAWLILAIVAVNIAIGLVQVASGGQTLLFYTASDKGAFLGFFANKNHAALVLAASLPLAAYALGTRGVADAASAHPSPARGSRPMRGLQPFQARGARTWLALWAGVVLVAIVTTNSRAGLALGLVVLLVLGSLYVRAIRPIHVVGVAVLAVLALVLISTTSAFETVVNRFNDVDDDLRWQFLWTSRPLIERYWIWGSGIGSFVTLYAANENLAWVKPTFVNQMHNEYPQLLLEAGIAGVVVLAMLVAGIVRQGGRLWLDPSHRAHRLPLVCGALIIVLIAFHSVVDYPLRRSAVMPLLAMALVLVAREDLTASTGIVRRSKQRA